MKDLTSEYEYQRALILLSRKLRANATFEERCVWAELRNRRLHGFKFVRQHVLKNFIVDFFCVQCGLIIEIDGSQHRSEEIVMCDNQRDSWLAVLGYRVVRISNYEVRNNLECWLKEITELCVQRQNFKLTSHMNKIDT